MRLGFFESLFFRASKLTFNEADNNLAQASPWGTLKPPKVLQYHARFLSQRWQGNAGT